MNAYQMFSAIKDYERTADRILTLINASGYSQTELAVMMGVDKSVVSREIGGKKMNAEHLMLPYRLEDYANAFGCTVFELLDDEMLNDFVQKTYSEHSFCGEDICLDL